MSDTQLVFLDRRGFLRTTGGLLLSLTSLGLIGCGGSGSNNSSGNSNGSGGGTLGFSLTSSTIPVTVTFPPGMKVPTGAQVQTSLGTSPLVSGKSQATIFNGGPHFAQVVDSSGNILLVGWVGSNGSVLNTHTTAEVLLYFKLAGPLLTDDLILLLIHALATDGNTQTLANAIGTALAASPLALTNADPSVKTALVSAYNALAPASGEGGSSARRPQGVTVNPGISKSGITINQPGINDIMITNSYRRRALYYVDKVSYVDSSGTNQPVKPTKQVANGDISPTVGATSTVGYIQGIIGGDVAYGPVSTNVIPVPLDPSNAKTTTYKVTVVGPGIVHAADMLTAERALDQFNLVIKVLFLDFLLPVLSSLVAIPALSNLLSAAVASDQAGNMVQDLLGLIGTVPGALTKAQSGDFEGALTNIYDAVRTTNTFRVALGKLIAKEYISLSQAFPKYVSGLSQTTPFLSALEGDGSMASAGKTGLFTILSRFDAILTAVDVCIQIADIAVSNSVENWDITVNGSKVNLTPALLDVIPGVDIDQAQVFTATVPSVSGSSQQLTYHWHISGTGGGTITDGIHTGTDFDSPKSSVSYQSGKGEGSDTLTVEVFQGTPATGMSLGTAQAPITIKASLDMVLPSKVQLTPGEPQTFSVNNTLPGTSTYIWSTSGQFGTLVPTSGAETPNATATYTAGSKIGSDTVSCLIKHNATSILDEPYEFPTESATVTIVARKTQYFGTFSVDVVSLNNTICSGYNGNGYQIFANTHFLLMPGAKSYQVDCYGFNDPYAYGTGGAHFSFSAADPGQAGVTVNGNAATRSLSGGTSTCGSPSAADFAYYNSRFAGIIVEVNVTY